MYEPDFLIKLKALKSTTSDADVFNNFVKLYGTHFVTDIEAGARATTLEWFADTTSEETVNNVINYLRGISATVANVGVSHDTTNSASASSTTGSTGSS